MEYKPTIGLEIHVELNTKSKLFCGCKNDSEEREPNVHICPICMAHPGTLPLINKEAIKKVILVGLALKGNIAKETRFDRKHYFYPDIPKGYQISQYKHPLVSNGSLNDIDITRIHLEEDTARSNHEISYGATLVDFNRAGVSLMELVTEPVIKSSEEAGAFAKELKILLRHIGVSNARMEKSEMRIEANISVSKNDSLGTKVEVKNLNSFKSIVCAIDYEIKRQIETLEKGDVVIQETRGWDENKSRTFIQRIKESAKDYRYLPEPDIPPLYPYEVEELNPDKLINEIKELPKDIRKKYISMGVKGEHIDILFDNEELFQLFKGAIKLNKEDRIFRLINNYLFRDVISNYKVLGYIKINANTLVDIMKMIDKGDLSSNGARELISILVKEGGDAIEVATQKGLLQNSDEDSLTKLVDTVLKNNDNVVKEYKNGKKTSLQFLLGQAMKESNGNANPETLKKILLKKLS